MEENENDNEEKKEDWRWVRDKKKGWVPALFIENVEG